MTKTKTNEFVQVSLHELKKQKRKLHIIYCLLAIATISWLAFAYNYNKTYESIFKQEQAIISKTRQTLTKLGETRQAQASTEAPKVEAEMSMKEWIRWYTESKGLDWNTTSCVIKNESGFNPKAWNANTNDTIDVGIWQGNSIHFKQCDINCMLDYKKQTKWAVEKRLKDGNWKAWYGSRNCK